MNTAIELPEPPIPSDVDLRDFPFTPIYRSRLFGSSFHARVSDAGWRVGVTLWLKSWDQYPAGSLPDDDIDLCRLAELGRDLKTWRKVKEEALHGWFKCSDGRLYHNVVAEGINEAWNRKCAQRHRTEAARAARAAKQQSQNENDTATTSVTGELPLCNRADVAEKTAPRDRDRDSKKEGGGGSARDLAEIELQNAESSTGSAGQQPNSTIEAPDTDRDIRGAVPTPTAAEANNQQPDTEPERAIAKSFLELRDRFWPNCPNLPAPTLTLIAQAKAYLDLGGTVPLIVEIVERGMRTAASQGKSASGSLKAFNLSISDAIASHRAGTDITEGKPHGTAHRNGWAELLASGEFG